MKYFGQTHKLKNPEPLFPLAFFPIPGLQGITRSGDGCLAADRAAGRSSEAFPFCKNKTALPAFGRDEDKLIIRSRGLGQVV